VSEKNDEFIADKIIYMAIEKIIYKGGIKDF